MDYILLSEPENLMKWACLASGILGPHSDNLVFQDLGLAWLWMARAAEILVMSRIYLYRLLKKSTVDQGLQDEEAENEETKLVAPKTLKHA
jgi:hypothetical protein